MTHSSGPSSAITLHWKESRPNDGVRVAAVREGSNGSLWAIGHQRDWLKKTSVVLHRFSDRWTRAFELDRRLTTICVNADESVIAAGDRVAAHLDGDAWVVRTAPTWFTRLWGARGDCAYGLSPHGLFHFDGIRWVRVDLTGKGIQGQWADGHCRVDGTSWIVGMNGTHSCMARGRGAEWTRDACSSWYLYRVHIENDVGFAAGGDGLWELTGDRWESVAEYGMGPGTPLSLTSQAGKPVVLACDLTFLSTRETYVAHAVDTYIMPRSPFRVPWPAGMCPECGEVFQSIHALRSERQYAYWCPNHHRWTHSSPPPSPGAVGVVFVFADGRWTPIALPEQLRPSPASPVHLAMERSGTLLAVTPHAIWQSSIVEGAVRADAEVSE